MLKAGVCTALNAETLAQLKDKGIKSVADFLVRDPEQLSQELHIAYKNICSIRHVLLAEHSAFPVSAISMYQNSLSSLAILSTGWESLDQLLDGGLYTGELTEIAGETAAGKTQMCMRCVATTVKTAEQAAVYIDTSSAFSTECLVDMLGDHQDMLALHDKDTEALVVSGLQRIRCMQVFDIFNLFAALDVLMTELRTQGTSKSPSVKLVIVDNVASLIYPIMGGHPSLSQGYLSQIGLKLKQMAVQLSLAVLITNNMTSSYKGSDRKPSLGKAWSHVPHTRLTISRCDSSSSHDNSLREVSLIKSCRQQTPSKMYLSLKRGASELT